MSWYLDCKSNCKESIASRIPYIESVEKNEIFMHIDDVLDHTDQFERPDPPSHEAAVSKQDEIRGKLEAAKKRIELMHQFMYEDDGSLDCVDKEIEVCIMSGVPENDIMNRRFEKL
jgi:hypothetical protein